MDFKKLIARYRQFGGTKLVWEYAKLGVLPVVVKGLWRFTAKGSWFKVGVFQCCKGLYGEMIKKVEPFMMDKYGTHIPQKVRYDNLNHNDNKRIIWWCWLQGLENAPEMVQACYNSVRRYIPDKVIKVIDAKNWKEYVELPDYITKKWEKGRIPAAMFSDLLRVELLIKYGGTWIDSTVLCTGFNDNHNDNENSKDSKLATDSKLSTLNSRLKLYMDAPLFVFQYTKEGSVPVSISNWFITACRNNEVLRVLREMLYAYWRDYDCVLDYYIFHLFFAMVSKECPEQMAAMPYAQSQRSLVLLHHWGEKFDQRKWNRLTSEVCFHKLAFRVSDSVKNDKDNYYNHILRIYE